MALVIALMLAIIGPLPGSLPGVGIAGITGFVGGEVAAAGAPYADLLGDVLASPTIGSQNNGYAITVGELDWTDYIITADVKIDRQDGQWPTLKIWTRHTGTTVTSQIDWGPGYRFNLSSDNNVSVVTPADWNTPLNGGFMTFPGGNINNDFISIAILAIGSQLTMYCNGTQLFSFENNTYAAGRIAVVLTNLDATINDFKVYSVATGTGPPPEPEDPVDGLGIALDADVNALPDGKIAITGVAGAIAGNDLYYEIAASSGSVPNIGTLIGAVPGAAPLTIDAAIGDNVNYSQFVRVYEVDSGGEIVAYGELQIPWDRIGTIMEQHAGPTSLTNGQTLFFGDPDWANYRIDATLRASITSQQATQWAGAHLYYRVPGINIVASDRFFIYGYNGNTPSTPGITLQRPGGDVHPSPNQYNGNASSTNLSLADLRMSLEVQDNRVQLYEVASNGTRTSRINNNVGPANATGVFCIENARCTSLTVSDVVLYRIRSATDPIPGDSKPKIAGPIEVRRVDAPVAGHYPRSFFKNGNKDNTYSANPYTQTLTWSPAVTGTFNTSSEYTATIRLTPVSGGVTFVGTELGEITNLPAAGAKTITFDGDEMLINIAFPATGAAYSAADEIFFDDFTNGFDTTKWGKGPQGHRQGDSGMASWQDSQSAVVNDQLVLSFVKNPALAPSYLSATMRNNYIAAGAVRTRPQNDGGPYFENSFGYYEASVKFPKIAGMWGAFWLYSPYQGGMSDDGVDGTEIDIVESYNNPSYNGFNVARHWNGYPSTSTAQNFRTSNATGSNILVPMNIYDGDFHTFALAWTPTEYIYYVDDIELFRDTALPQNTRGGIAQNPNYLKLTIEAANWVSNSTIAADSGEMVVDWVRVLNGPKVKEDDPGVPDDGLNKITNAVVRPIDAPVAGHYPKSFFRNNLAPGTSTSLNYHQTLTWSPEVEKTFLPGTVYTATVRLEANSASNSFQNVPLTQVGGLPTAGAKTVRYDGRAMEIDIVFDATGATAQAADLIFNENFDTSTNGGLGSYFLKGPQDHRQQSNGGMNQWVDGQTSVRDNQLILGFQKEPNRAPAGVTGVRRDNYLASGAVRTRGGGTNTTPQSTITWENAYGYYEASIKFPQVDGMWGAFWLYGPMVAASAYDGVRGTEIDIVETILNMNDNSFNYAWHWNGYGSEHESTGPPTYTTSEFAAAGWGPINIYDGQFHKFALDWTPTEYVFLLDDVVIYRTDALPVDSRGGICQNPNYLKLTIEAADWASVYGGVSEDSGEMVVDYVKVWNGPNPTIADYSDQIGLRDPSAGYPAKTALAVRGTPADPAPEVAINDPMWDTARNIGPLHIKSGMLETTTRSESIKTMWDDEFLYIRADIFDEDVYVNHANSANYQSDSVEVYVNFLNNKDEGSHPNSHQINVTAGGRIAWGGSTYSTSTVRNRARYSAYIKPDGTGYLIYMALPWYEITAAPGFSVPPSSEVTISFDAQVNECQTAVGGRTHTIGWNDEHDQAWASAYYWGHLQLVDAPDEPDTYTVSFRVFDGADSIGYTQVVPIGGSIDWAEVEANYPFYNGNIWSDVLEWIDEATGEPVADLDMLLTGDVVLVPRLYPADTALVYLTGPATAVSGAAPGSGPAEVTYTISARLAPVITGVELEFEVDGDFLSSKDFAALSGFEFFGAGNYGTPIYWRNEGNKWIGKVTLLDLAALGGAGGGSGGGAQPPISGDIGIMDMTFYIVEGVLGPSDVKLNYIKLSSLSGPVDCIIVSDTATTVFEQYYSPYDLNKDGVVDLNDLTFALQYLTVSEGDPDWDVAKAMDYNDSKDIDIGDLILILANYTVPYYS